MSRRRHAAERRGRAAELLAAAFLILKGYRVLGRRLRTPYGEVDLAAFKHGVLVIVEVKARALARAGLEAITPRQQSRIAQAAAALASRWRLTGAPIRFDVIVVRLPFVIAHERGAWDALNRL